MLERKKIQLLKLLYLNINRKLNLGTVKELFATKHRQLIQCSLVLHLIFDKDGTILNIRKQCLAKYIRLVFFLGAECDTFL